MEENFPFEQGYVDYLEIELGLSKWTIKGYCRANQMFVRFLRERWFPNELFVTRVEEKHVRNYLAYLKKERMNKPATRNKQLVSLRSYFCYLEIQGCIADGE